MHGMVNIAVRAARRAGELMVRQLNQLESLHVVEKSRNEFVTQVDQAAEAAIIEIIREYYPDHAILAEESGATGESEYQWIIDPLDGTTNYVHGFPVFSVSIGVAHRGEIEHGVVYDPLRQEIFTASRGQGAQLDGRKIRVSKRTTIQQSLVATVCCSKRPLKRSARDITIRDVYSSRRSSTPIPIRLFWRSQNSLSPTRFSSKELRAL